MATEHSQWTIEPEPVPQEPMYHVARRKVGDATIVITHWKGTPVETSVRVHVIGKLGDVIHGLSLAEACDRAEALLPDWLEAVAREMRAKAK